MTLRQRAAWIVFIAVAACRIAAGADPPENFPPTLGDVPKIKLEARPPLKEAEKQRIKELIKALADIDAPDMGMSPTVSGTDFVAIGGQGQAETMVLTRHDLQTAEAFKDLVTIGPDALPFLLDPLDDQTPTKLAVQHNSSFGGMWYDQELQINPVNSLEAVATKDLKTMALSSQPPQMISSYSVKVGDVCFVAIGEIVGRAYQAVRYQPTACVVINSPTHDAALCAAVRQIWKSDDPRRKVLDSLCIDYGTRGTFNGRSLDGWDMGSRLQCCAAQKLLFYYGKETSAMLASRLDGLDVSHTPEGDADMRRDVAAGVRPDAFIKVLSWSKDPAIQKSLTGVFSRSGDIECLLAALPAVQDKGLARKRLEDQITALPADDRGPYGDGCDLLRALIEVSPAAAKGAFVRYLDHAGINRKHTVCVTLRGVKVDWDMEILGPLLADTQTLTWTYAITPGQDEPRLPIRICDEAAVSLAWNHRDLKFKQAGQYADMDKQIAEMRAAIKGK